MKRSDSRIPSLDGLRAFSIAGVLVSHAFFAYGLDHQDLIWVRLLRNLGPLGVGVFFGISGFLITSLLQREREQAGRISLTEFYLRRAFRILPPFWAYVAVMWLVSAPVPEHGYRNALLFLTDYLPSGWWLGHSWSLSVEEQFYLLWPVTVVLAGRWSRWASLVLLLASPVIRVVHGHYDPDADLASMWHTRIDALMAGCWLALSRQQLRGTAFLRFLTHNLTAAVAAFTLVIGSPLLTIRHEGAWAWPVGWSLEALAVMALLAWAVERPETAAGRFLNWKPVARLGVLSYSLYLWQQPFFAGESWGTWSGTFPMNVLGALGMAMVSYALVEQPCLALRDRVIAWRRARRAHLAPAPAAANAAAAERDAA
ncbi:MAG: acyltransferase [Anaeromyxobacter sp.]